jgi:sulfopyruvate decarboxylase subunit beta
MMRRDECLAALLPHVADEIVIGTYSTAFDWIKLRPDHPLNYNSVGAMGLASSHGLGLALARPDRRVIVLDGDGSLLMNLGSLVTIGTVAPSNLYHFVSENGTYEANGGHPIPGRDRLSFADMAKAAGYRKSYTYSDIAVFKAGIGMALSEPGPIFIDLKVVPGEPFLPGPDDFNALFSRASREKFKDAFGRL